MSSVLLVLQLVLAGAFVAAAAGKGLRADEFVAALRLSHLPESTIPLLSICVPAVEVLLAFWLVLAPPGTLWAPFAVALLVLLVFTGWMLWVNSRQLRVRCGCFGPNGGDVGPATIARNVILMVIAVAGLMLSRITASPLPGFSLDALIAASALGMSVALVQALRLAWPHLILTFDQFTDSGLGDLE